MPCIKGLFDIRMGTTDMGKICGTCGQNNINCWNESVYVTLGNC